MIISIDVGPIDTRLSSFKEWSYAKRFGSIFARVNNVKNLGPVVIRAIRIAQSAFQGPILFARSKRSFNRIGRLKV
jgi:hypothetical protein